jgi:hypothetical protein
MNDTTQTKIKYQDKSDLVADKIGKNFELFNTLLDKLENKEQSVMLKKFVKTFQTEIMLCPASAATSRIGCFHGGLVWNSINVLKTMKDLNKIYEANLSVDELIITSLFHDIGKIGDGTKSYYKPQTENWKKDRGFMYEIDEAMLSIPVSTRSIFLLNSNGIKLSLLEVNAITSLNHISQMYATEFYNVSPLTLLLQEAVRGCCVMNKNVKNVLGDI